MATKAKATSSSCLSFLKDALLLPTRNAKLFVPVFLLVAIPTFILQITNVFCVEPLTSAILLHVNELKNMDPSSADYAKLVAEMLKEARELAIIAIAVMIAGFVSSVASQIVTFFAASTTYSGDRYSLLELFSKVIMKGRRLVGPLVTIAMVSVLNVACALLTIAMVSVLVACALLLTLLLPTAIRHSGAPLLLCMVVLVVFPFLAFLYVNAVFVVATAASAADAERRGVSALGQAWRLMTQVWRKQGCVLVVVVHLVAMVPSPLYALALGYAKKSMPMGLALLVVHALLSSLVQLFYMSAATVYYYQAMESKQEEVLVRDYVKIPTGEATV